MWTIVGLIAAAFFVIVIVVMIKNKTEVKARGGRPRPDNGDSDGPVTPSSE